MFISWRRGMVFWAIVFIFIGVVVWLGNLGIFDFRWGRDWPVLLLILGIYCLTKAIPRRRRSRKAKVRLSELLSKLESGDITAEEAAEEMEE